MYEACARGLYQAAEHGVYAETDSGAPIHPPVNFGSPLQAQVTVRWCRLRMRSILL